MVTLFLLFVGYIAIKAFECHFCDWRLCP